MKYLESDIAKMNIVIDKFVASNIIEEGDHCQDEYISNIFPVPKKNKDVRIILNLKFLNPAVSYGHFKMEHFDSAVKLVERNCFLASIDLKDAYYSVSIHKSCRKYLKFLWNS